jgi:hypothetical protein
MPPENELAENHHKIIPLSMKKPCSKGKTSQRMMSL